MGFLVFRLVLALQLSCISLAGRYGCNPTESLPACSDVESPGFFPNHARLTGAPTFSSLEIAPGDPLTIAVPVDVNTRSVRVRIRSQNLPGIGTGGDAETNGGESVDVLVEDTNLPASIYFADSIDLEGERSGEFASYYILNAEPLYIQSIASTNADGSDRCLTDFAAAQFRITSDASDQP
jgi:hypothetical protein